MTSNVLPADVLTLLGIADAVKEVGTTRGDIKVWLDGLNHYHQGLDGNDTITGNTGNNYIEGGAGADAMLLDLGGSNDTLGYFNSDAAVNVTLGLLGIIQSASGGHAQGDSSLGGFENIVGSDLFGDTRWAGGRLDKEAPGDRITRPPSAPTATTSCAGRPPRSRR